MNKTIYLRDEESPIWERARELANDKLSPIIVTALRRFIFEKEAAAKGYERIEVKFNDSLDNNLPKIKAFYGRWLINVKDPFEVMNEEGNQKESYSVAETAKGNVVVFTHFEDHDSVWGYRLVVFPSFQLAASNSDFNIAIRTAIERRGVPVEELDI